jgi:tRNA/tmRNA/rRNA uracil-C5-methylase (TrmA/RlmC/RlmD family)
MKIIRPNTSDEKAYKEIVGKGYERRDFKPEPGEKWLDIGGHIGSFSYHYSKQGVDIIAFEPSLESFEILKQNAPDVEAHNIGLGDKDEELTLYINSANGNHWRNSTMKKWARGE